MPPNWEDTSQRRANVIKSGNRSMDRLLAFGGLRMAKIGRQTRRRAGLTKAKPSYPT